jgi:hypothetical protein
LGPAKRKSLKTGRPSNAARRVCTTSRLNIQCARDRNDDAADLPSAFRDAKPPAGVGVHQQQQALRLIGTSLVGLAVSCALVLQLLLVGLALGGAASAASASGEPFVICYGDGGGDAGHDPDRKSGAPLHCLLACAQAHGGLAPTLPASAPAVHPPQSHFAPAFRAATVSIPSRFGAAHPSRGPPEA